MPAKKRRWTPDEDALIIEHYQDYTYKEIRDKFLPHRTEKAIGRRRRVLGLHRKERRKKPITATEDDRCRWEAFWESFCRAYRIAKEYDARTTPSKLFVPYLEQYATEARAAARAERPHVIETPAEKRCSRCGHVKPASDFTTDRREKTGLASWCKACRSAHLRRWRAQRGQTNAEDEQAAIR